MSIQAYRCKKDGEFEHKQGFNTPVAQSLTCPKCGEDSEHIFYPPSIRVKRTWNDGANEIRRDPYTQAKSQINNTINDFRDQGLSLPKANDEMYTEAAKQINKHKEKTLTDEQKVVKFLKKQKEVTNANRTRN